MKSEYYFNGEYHVVRWTDLQPDKVTIIRIYILYNENFKAWQADLHVTHSERIFTIDRLKEF